MTPALRELARRLGNPIGGAMAQNLETVDTLEALARRVVELFGDEVFADAVQRAGLQLRLAHGAIGLLGRAALKDAGGDVALPLAFRDCLERELRAMLREH